MRAKHIRLIARIGIVALLVVPLPAGGAEPRPPAAARAHASARPDGPSLGRDGIPAVSPQVFAAALVADGSAIRTAGLVTVERVRVPPRLRAGDPTLPTSVFRVTVGGTYPPRAQRYVVLADGRPVGFGIPSPGQRELVTVTADPAVVEAEVTAVYGDPRRAPVGSTAAPPGGARQAGVEDPAAWGPHDVVRSEYDLGDRVFALSEPPRKVELAGDVHHPADLDGGSYPLVLFMHGNHSTCFRGNRASYVWPCRRGWEPLPNYAGYDYVAARLASWGYVVASVSANGVNYFGNFVDDTGMRQRGEVLERHIELWEMWTTVGGEPFGDTFVGSIDLDRIGTMGHSRGGEGAIWHTIVDRERAAPFGIDAVLALAPVDFTRVTINEVAFSVVLPSCDGDVYDLQGIHFFDDSRYAVPGDQTAKSTVTVFGANHNFFNTVWSPSGGYPGAFDDGQWSNCRDRLTEPQERHVGAAYIAGFFRRYVGGDASLDPMWTGAETPDVPARTAVSYLAPAGERLDVDRFTAPDDLAFGQIGQVTSGSMSVFGWCSDEWQTPCLPGQEWLDVHLSFSFLTSEPIPGLGQGVLGWTAPGATVRFAIGPAWADVSGFDVVQVRTALNPAYPANADARVQDFAMALVDGTGRRSEVAASTVGNGPLARPNGRRGSGHYILNQIRFPLELFSGIDLTDVRVVELVFSRTPMGTIDVADLAFSRGSS